MFWKLRQWLTQRSGDTVISPFDAPNRLVPRGDPAGCCPAMRTFLPPRRSPVPPDPVSDRHRAQQRARAPRAQLCEANLFSLPWPLRQPIS